MTRILNAQNSCLEAIVAETEALLASEAAIEADALERLRESRARPVRVFGLLDQRLAQAAQSEASPLDPEAHNEIAKRDSLIARLTEADTRLGERVRASLDAISREIASARRGRETLTKFKSGQDAEPGRELDRTL